MHTLFEECVQCVIDREKSLFDVDDDQCKNDIVADKLFQPRFNGSRTVAVILQIICAYSWLLSDHLQGGDYESVTDSYSSN